MATLLLDILAWDLVVDANGNIAVAQAPYALAQDAASACRLFLGELWYDTTKGVPYWTQILGHAPPIQLIKAKMVDAAKSVPGVVAAKCFLTSVSPRAVSGQIQVTDSSGVTTVASF